MVGGDQCSSGLVTARESESEEEFAASEAAAGQRDTAHRSPGWPSPVDVLQLERCGCVPESSSAYTASSREWHRKLA